MKIDNNYTKCKRIAGRFINYHSETRVRRTLLDFFLWKLGYYDLPESEIILPIDYKHPKLNRVFSKDHDWVSWVNHCTFLIKFNDYHLLTDPVWNKTCSPINFIGPKRRHGPGIAFKELPKIDYVTISHDHYDHLDKKSILMLHKQFPDIQWIVPLGIKKWFQKHKIQKVIELDWWECYEDNNVNVCSVPAQHYSGRWLFDGNKRLWCGFVMKDKKNNKKVYFTGDTGYNPSIFKSIGSEFEKIDLALIPIGTYIPRKFMKPIHINPEESVKIHSDVNSQLSVGMHWKTFHLSDENLNLPPYELLLQLHTQNVDPANFIVVDPGSYTNF